MGQHPRSRQSGGGSDAQKLRPRLQRRFPMCPACISTTALLLGGFLSTGGVAALLARLRFKRNTKKLSGG
jgi:hypothetical protein